MSEAWQSRIVRREHADPTALKASPGNWREHGVAQMDAAEAVLDASGWVRDVLVNARTGHIVDGHLRVSIAIRRREPTVPVTYIDLSEAEEALALSTFDPIADLALADGGKLAALRGKMLQGNAILDALLQRAMGGAGAADDLPTGTLPFRANALETYATGDQRQIYVPLTVDEYPAVSQAIERIKAQHDYPRNTDALIWLLREDATAHAGQSIGT